MVTWALDSDGDLSISNRRPEITNTIEWYVAEKVKTKLRLFLGEWFLSPTAGLPYFQQIFKKNTDIDFVISLYSNAIENIDGVEEIQEFDFNYDNSIRKLSIASLKIIASDGITEITEFTL